MSEPIDIPPDAYASPAGELRALARVLRTAIGVVVAYWAATGLAEQHPYRRAVLIVDSYLKRRYGV